MSEETNKGNLVLIRVRGLTGVKKVIGDAMLMLRLYRKNYCVIIPNNKTNRGMCQKIKDFITWGEIDEETTKLLKDNRTRKTKDKQGKEIEKKFYALHPPRKGFERKGIKVSFNIGGALGYRGEKINELIKRMI
ncbi:MAG: uL30 family ribosomal protein [Nanoarchaeota archaeon]|nr:uL30 family ribosomal protein [Nanoarchaeota archaeon]